MRSYTTQWDTIPPFGETLLGRALKRDAQTIGANTVRLMQSAKQAAIKAAPPTMRALRKGGTETLRFLRLAGKVAAREIPPILRKLQAWAGEILRIIIKACKDGMEAYRRSRENQRHADKIEPPATPSEGLRTQK